MSIIGNLAGGGGQPGTWTDSMSLVISDISMNSRSMIFLTSFAGREAAGLNRPAVLREAGLVDVMSSPRGGPVYGAALVDDAAAARRSKPLLTVDDGENVGRVVRGGSEPSGWPPVGRDTEICNNQSVVASLRWGCLLRAAAPCLMSYGSGYPG